jgi:hypothetical protein
MRSSLLVVTLLRIGRISFLPIPSRGKAVKKRGA